MTSGGFLSPSREGRLAESKLLPFPEIKIDKPLEKLKMSVSLPSITKEPSKKILRSKKKTKSGTKKKQKGSKTQSLLSPPKEQKQEVLKKKKKPKEENILVPEPPIPEPVVEEIIDIINVTEKLQVPKKVILTSHSNKVKMEEVLPKFSFFGPLPPGPGLIPTTFPQIINPVIIDVPEKIEKPTSPVLKVEIEDIYRKEQKKKKKDKKKEKKEKRKQKEKIKEKEKEKEKKKEKLKSTNKVPKLKFRFGTRLETMPKVLAVEKPPETNITIVSEPEPMEVEEIESEIESKSDISLNILHDIDSPPKVPIQKIKTKIIVKTIQPDIPPVNETPPPAFYFDEAGNQVWICPMCTKPDDGSPMIGCDGCDVWYHWVCVGIQCPPDCAVWYCPRCLAKRAQQPKGKRGRPRKNK